MKAKKATCHGLTIHLVKKLPGRSNPENVLTVNAVTRKISVNEKIWRKTPQPMRYWLMVWARWTTSSDSRRADAMATRTYLARGYSRKALARWFTDLVRHRPTEANMKRVRAMEKQLKKYYAK